MAYPVRCDTIFVKLHTYTLYRTKLFLFIFCEMFAVALSTEEEDHDI